MEHREPQSVDDPPGALDAEATNSAWRSEPWLSGRELFQREKH
jgi:hypothetical protein